jgi:hypothetical protein
MLVLALNELHNPTAAIKVIAVLFVPAASPGLPPFAVTKT